MATGEAGAAALAGTITPALAACDAALARCLKLTEGTALPALARVLDKAVQQYVSALQAAVAGMRGRMAEAATDADADAAAESAEVVLPLLTVASQLVQRLALLEAGLRQAATETVPALLRGSEAAAGGGELPSAAALRLQAQPALRQQLSSFAASAASAVQLLPLAVAGASDLERFVAQCVLEVLTQRLQAQLAGVPRLAEWQQRAGSLPLPTFSAYPLQYITSGGWPLLQLDMVWRCVVCAVMFMPCIRSAFGSAALPIVCHGMIASHLLPWLQPAAAPLGPANPSSSLVPCLAVGEYLMMLPQQLESALLSEDDGEEAGQLVGDWIDKVGCEAGGGRWA